MTTRARELLNRSRAFWDGSRAAATQLLGPPPRDALPHRPGATAAPAPGATAAPAPGAAAESALSAICADLALRDLNLVDALLSQREHMEPRDADADRLAELYRLDHRAARRRRNAENLRVLAGRDADDGSAETASLVDVIRGAMSSIDHYQRVSVGRVANLGVVGFAAEDVSRLLSELLDNATKSSPPHTEVRVGAHLTESGSALLRVQDDGIGVPAERLRELNERLSAPPVLDDDAVRHMGLAVVCRLASRHGIRAWLDHRAPHGTTASVLLPAALVCELPDAAWSGLRTVAARAGTAADTGPAAVPAMAPGLDAADRPPLPNRRATETRPPAAGRPAVPASRRAEAEPAPPPRPAAAPTTAGTTASGLPRRVAHSLRDSSGDGAAGSANGAAPAPVADSAADLAADRAASHQQLLADLDAFSDGERAAREDQEDKGSEP
ncbi:sensor histidine kinase [Frankia sp. CNm7]|uniref:sensor histidine kinase n=1 Tax=Frankia nepalensis TaxID=1836974 RepID=UPI0019345F1F|nr:ATP-binding protein [Frankia nepalensis]MBL7521176.1 sensor histidine kinase [Frankia nepalensis]